jgi:hypothetical protein
MLTRDLKSFRRGLSVRVPEEIHDAMQYLESSRREQFGAEFGAEKRKC